MDTLTRYPMTAHVRLVGAMCAVRAGNFASAQGTADDLRLSGVFGALFAAQIIEDAIAARRIEAAKQEDAA